VALANAPPKAVADQSQVVKTREDLSQGGDSPRSVRNQLADSTSERGQESTQGAGRVAKMRAQLGSNKPTPQPPCTLDTPCCAVRVETR